MATRFFHLATEKKFSVATWRLYKKVNFGPCGRLPHSQAGKEKEGGKKGNIGKLNTQGAYQIGRLAEEEVEKKETESTVGGGDGGLWGSVVLPL